MSRMMHPPIGYLLTRDRHVMPVHGLEPDALKGAALDVIKSSNRRLSHAQALTAAVKSLGFKGDFGNYKNEVYPALADFMAREHLATRRNLFDVPVNDLYFHTLADRRQALADRFFFARRHRPKRAFLGWDYDWSKFPFNHLPWLEEDDRFEPSDLASARDWLSAHATELLGLHNFIGDQLLAIDGDAETVVELYVPQDADESAGLAVNRAEKAMRVLRWLVDQSQEGWVEVLRAPGTDQLIFLRGSGGAYDVLWANYRQEPPPSVAAGAESLLSLEDQPTWIRAKADVARELYFRTDVSAEKEHHEAEVHYYANGGKGLPEYPGANSVRWTYLAETGVTPIAQGTVWSGSAPSGFTRVGDLLVSDLVTIDDFRRFQADTGYHERRTGEDLLAANPDADHSLPVGATYADALAFAAWKERDLGVSVRLMTVDEHRAIRPLPSEHYGQMAGRDFPWERWPPRAGLVSGLRWSEPRFESPGPDLPEFPEDVGGFTSSPSRRRWIPQENWPPAAGWTSEIPWIEYAGLDFIDAWDVYEWCDSGRVAGRFWHGVLGATSWGEYKNVKVTFRVVLDASNSGGAE